MNAGVLGQSIGDEDTDSVAFNRFKGRAWGRTVIAPTFGDAAGRKLMFDFLGHEVELLDASDQSMRQAPSV
jgi:hypothetical protein